MITTLEQLVVVLNWSPLLACHIDVGNEQSARVASTLNLLCEGKHLVAATYEEHLAINLESGRELTNGTRLQLVIALSAECTNTYRTILCNEVNLEALVLALWHYDVEHRTFACQWMILNITILLLTEAVDYS